MKTLAIIVNIFLPGVGTLIVKKWGQGIAQILLYILGWVFVMTAVLSIIGFPLIIGIWVWAIISAVQSNPEPMQVKVEVTDK